METDREFINKLCKFLNGKLSDSDGFDTENAKDTLVKINSMVYHHLKE